MSERRNKRIATSEQDAPAPSFYKYIPDKELNWRDEEHWKTQGSGRFSLRNWYDFKEMVQIAKSKRTQTTPAP